MPDNHANQLTQSTTLDKPLTQPAMINNNVGLTQAYILRNFAFEAAMALRRVCSNDKGELTITRDDAQAIGVLLRGHDTCCERIRIIKGRPLPGSLKPTKPNKRSKARDDIAPTLAEE